MPLAAAAIMTPEQKASKDKSANLVTMTPTPHTLEVNTYKHGQPFVSSKPPSRSKINANRVTQVESKSLLEKPPKVISKAILKSNPARKISTQEPNGLSTHSKANDLISMVTNDLIARA